jgi:hypothetical protein
MKMWTAAAAAVSVMGAAGAQADAPDVGQKDLVQAVKAFLADHGDLCLGWYTWPRDLTAAEQQTGMNEAVQLPVLERLGVVRSAEVTSGAPTRRYSLTAKGKRYYLHKTRITLNVHSQSEEHDADFCAAHLTLDKVVKWTPPETANGHLETVAQYTYHIKAADWMTDPEARKVFPVVDRIIRGEGRMLMSATVAFKDGQWVPVLPGQ